jgi:hypothetical protein
VHVATAGAGIDGAAFAGAGEAAAVVGTAMDDEAPEVVVVVEGSGVPTRDGAGALGARPASHSLYSATACSYDGMGVPSSASAKVMSVMNTMDSVSRRFAHQW